MRFVELAADGTFISDDDDGVPLPVVVDPVALLAEVGTDLAAIPATATSTQMRTALRTVGQKITEAIPT